MKSTFFTLLICCASLLNSFAQDIIYLKTGEEIKAKVKDVKQTEISYLKFENLGGPTYTISKSSVMMIKYENGHKDIFLNEPSAEKEVFVENNSFELNSLAIPPAHSYEKGMADALVYYNGQNSGKGGVLVTSLLINGLFGLIPAVACSSSPPKMQNLNLPNISTYQNNPDYARGYLEQAKKIKSKKVWRNWGIGSLISTVIILVASSAG